MMRRSPRALRPAALLLAILSLSWVALSPQAGAQTGPQEKEKPAPVVATQPPSPAAVSAYLNRVKKLKAAGKVKEAQELLLDAPGAYWRDPRVPYHMGWLSIAQKRESMATYYFRTALRDGLPAREAREARGALKRMGVSETFPARKRRSGPLNPALDMRLQGLQADFNRPPLGQWLLETAIIAAVTAVGWGLICGIMSLASGVRPGTFDLKCIGFWTLLLVGLRLAGQFAVSNTHILPLIMIYLALAVGLLLASLFYAGRRLFTKKKKDKGAIVAWGCFYTLLMLLLVGTRSFMASYILAVAALAAVSWLLLNPWFVVSQWAEQLKNKGDINGALSVQERFLGARWLDGKTRFAMLNDMGSNYLLVHQPEKAIQAGEGALQHVSAFQSAEVLTRLNMAEAYLEMGRQQEAVDQLGKVWHLTVTTDCIMGNNLWQGSVHGVLAWLNYWRGWLDEAEHQADKCLAAFPAELRGSQGIKNYVAICRAIKAMVRLRQGDLEAASRLAEAAPKAAPKRLALAFVQTVASEIKAAGGYQEEALQLARAAVATSPGYLPAEMHLAGLLAHSGETETARDIMHRAILQNPAHHLQSLACSRLENLAGPAKAPAEAQPATFTI